jgi:hypothetical protein
MHSACEGIADAEENFLTKAVDISTKIRYFSKSLALMPPSSRGLGHLPFTEVTGIRIPLGVLSGISNK